MTIIMTLRNPLDKEKLLPVYIEPNDTVLAVDWIAALKIELKKNSLLEKNYCWHGWTSGSRNLEYLCKELSKHTQTVYHYNDLGIWQSAGLANIKINTVYTPDTVMLPLTDESSSGGPNHEVMNEVHNYFEHLQGTVENLSSYYKLAPPNVKYAIRQINNLCHEIETLCLSLRKQKFKPDWIRPSQITTFLNATRCNLTDEHRQGFISNGYDRKFAHVYMHWTQIGKTLMEVFRDEGAPTLDQATCDAITHLQYYSGEFDIEWGKDVTVYSSPWHLKEVFEFEQWLQREGYNPRDPSLSLGYLELASIDLQRSFGTTKEQDIWTLMSDYLDIYSLEVDGVKAIYDYSWSDADHEQRQIQFLMPGYNSHNV